MGVWGFGVLGFRVYGLGLRGLGFRLQVWGLGWFRGLADPSMLHILLNFEV